MKKDDIIDALLMIFALGFIIIIGYTFRIVIEAVPLVKIK